MQAQTSEQVLIDSKSEFSATQTLAGTAKTVEDVPIPALSSDYEISVGIPDTAQIKSFALRNKGTQDLSVKIGSTGSAVALGAGEALAFSGPGITKAALDILIGGTALDSILVTNGSSSDAGEVALAVFFDAPVP